MNGADERIFEQAADWHLASAGEHADWDAFTCWLEVEPRHRIAYEEIALADAALDDHRFEPAEFANDADIVTSHPRVARKWPLWTGGALAATLAAILVVPQLTNPTPRTFTSGDSMQAVTLDDGSQVVLGPHSQLTVAGRDGQQLALQGGAYFAIRHNPSREMTIAAGGLKIGDIGTRFEVQANGDAVRVEVSEGQVELTGDALDKAVELVAGRRMLFDPALNLATVAPVSGSDVGEWRQGRLSYDAAPLSLVAADLSRYAGISVTVPAPLGGRRFSGTLSIHDGDSAVRDLAQLMGLDVSRGAGAYRLGQRR